MHTPRALLLIVLLATLGASLGATAHAQTHAVAPAPPATPSCSGNLCPAAPEWITVPDHNMTTLGSYDVAPYCLAEPTPQFSLASAVAGVSVSNEGLVTASTAGTRSVGVRCLNAHGFDDVTVSLTVTEADGVGGNTVNSMAEALALSGLAEGDTVVVLGYYEAGDEGGGTFYVTDSGATPDGGTVFAPNSVLSAEQTEEVASLSAINASSTYNLVNVTGGGDVVLGTFELDMIHADTVAFSVEDWNLHGVRYQMGELIPSFRLDLAAGQVQDRKQHLKEYCQNLFGSTGLQCGARFRYKYTTSDLRLERQGITDTYVPEWFGIEADSTADFQPRMNWMLWSLRARNAVSPGSITAVEFPKAAVYGYYGSIMWPDGVTLRGQGGTELVTVTNDLGLTYSPVRLKDVRTELRVNDYQALAHARMSINPTGPDSLAFLAWDSKWVFRDRPTVIFIENDAQSAGVEDIYLNGNWENNFVDAEGCELADNACYPYPKKEEWFRNNSGWTGFANRTFAPAVPQGQQVTLNNVAIIGYGATGALGNLNADWTGTNLRIGSSVWNHAIYQGVWDATNLTVVGHAWNHVAFQGGGIIRNLVGEDFYPSNIRDESFMFHLRGADAYDQAEVLADGNPNSILNDGTALEMYAEIYGCFIDLRGGADLLGIGFLGIGKDFGLSDCTIVGVPGRSPNLGYAWGTFGNNPRSLYPHYLFEHVTLQGRAQQLFGKMTVTRSVFRNITMTDSLVTDGLGLNTTMVLDAAWKNHPSWANGVVVVFDSITVEPRSNGIASVAVNPLSAGADYFVLNSSFNNSAGSVPFRDVTGNGRTANLGGDPALLRVYFRDTEFRFNTQRFDNAEAFLDLAYFDGVTDPVSGLGSEGSGSVSFTATGGETFVDVDPNLWWVPMDATYVTTANVSGATIASHAPVCADANAVDAYGNTTGALDDRRDCLIRFTFDAPLTAGQAVSFDWTASIKPWPEGVAVPDTTLWVPESGPRSAP